MVRSTGIEPASLPWHGKILPLYYERENGFEMVDGAGIEPAVRKRNGFTVRTKEPADVFPRRARLGLLRIITCFA